MTTFERIFSLILQKIGLIYDDPAFFWQIGTFIVAFAISYLVGRLIARHEKPEPASEDPASLKISRTKALHFISRPFVAFCVIAFFHPFVEKVGSTVLLDFVIALLLAITFIRLLSFILLTTFPKRWRWMITFHRSLNIAIWLILALYLAGAHGWLIEGLSAISFSIGSQKFNLWTIAHGLFTVGIWLLLALWIASLIETRLKAAKHIDSSVRVVLIRTTQAIFAVIAVFSSLSVIGVDVTAISVFSGALGVGLGFGFQKVASNYISGFIILFDRSIRIGNLVSIDSNTSGIVTQITTRYTVVRNLSGVEFIVPNETLVTNIVQNQSWSDNAVRIAIKIQISYSSNLEQAMAIMEAAARDNARVMTSPAPLAFLTEFADNGVNLELGFWINDPQEGTAYVRSQINMAIWHAFHDVGIEFPFPQREVRILGGAHGETVPLSIDSGTDGKN